jgi:uncharacterized protein (TIGR00297 family)
LPLRYRRAAIAVALGGLIAGLGWQRRALTADGALAGTAVGAATFGFGGLPASAGLVAFFVSGSALSRRKSVPGEVASAKGHRRDAIQVLANGGVAAGALALVAVAGAARFRGAALGALAAAAADTWASEIGVWSLAPPRSIVTGLVVPPGASGGVTPLGWGAAAAGGLCVGAAWTLVGKRRWFELIVALISGVAGSLADSLAGATIQAAYRCDVCGTLAETPGLHCGQPLRLARGHAWMTNDLVNLIGTAIGGVVGALLG